MTWGSARRGPGRVLYRCGDCGSPVPGDPGRVGICPRCRGRAEWVGDGAEPDYVTWFEQSPPAIAGPWHERLLGWLRRSA